MTEIFIKSVEYDPKYEEMNIEFFGGRGRETLKKCLCCEQYHVASLGVCPKTGKLLMAEAWRQAEEEERSRAMTRRQTKAEEAKARYLKDNFAGFRSHWRALMAMPGGLVIFVIVTYVLKVVLDKDRDAALIGFVIFIAWFLFWVLIDKRRYKIIRKRAENIFYRVCIEEEAETG